MAIMMKEKIEKVRQLLEKEFKDTDWRYHMLPVVRYAKELAKIYKVDEDVVELAALLHDVGLIDIKNDAKHHIVGVREAERILKELEFPSEVIDEVKHCVESHRRDKGPSPSTMTAKIVANADAMSHFDIFPLFFYWRADRYSFDETVDWVEEKIEDNLKEKITLPEARKLVQKKYKAIKLLLDCLEEYRK